VAAVQIQEQSTHSLTSIIDKHQHMHFFTFKTVLV